MCYYYSNGGLAFRGQLYNCAHSLHVNVVNGYLQLRDPIRKFTEKLKENHEIGIFREIFFLNSGGRYKNVAKVNFYVTYVGV